MSVLPTTGRFSGSHLTSGLLPIRCQFFLANGQWNNSPLGTPYGAKRFYYVLEFVNVLRISDSIIGADTYSGATAADFNRVPV